jgi:hypothetical protein
LTINITAVGGAGTHTFQKVNINLDENYLYFPGRDQNTLKPNDLTNESAWVVRETTGTIDGIDSGSVYFLNADDFSVGFSTTQGGDNEDLTEYSSGTITFNYPFVYENSFNISSVKYDDVQAVKYLTNDSPIVGLTSGDVYFVKNLLTGLGGSSLYQFTTHEFTSAGVTGQTGPTLTQLRNSYASTNWANTYLAQGNFQGYQDWTVPEDGVYEFLVKGAPGRQGRALGGGGAIVRGRVRLNRGEIITFAIGQRGALPPNNTAWPASSGGTFVVRKAGNIPLFVAGGGSSSSNFQFGFNAVLTTIGGTSQRGFGGGQNGNGAGGISTGGAGGGFFSRGGNSERGGGGGGFNDNLVGGFAAGGSSAVGGFGGGGGSDGEAWGGPGGAGGYGGGATNDRVGSQSGGGGGSFIFATATNVATSTGLFDGSATFLGEPIENLNTYNTGEVEGSVEVTLVERSVFGFSLHPTAEDANNEENAIPVQPAGSSYHALVPITLDIDTETIYQKTLHGFFDGKSINYFTNGVAAGGLTQSTVYYVNVVDSFSYKLSLTPDPNFTIVNITSPSDATVEGFRDVVVNTATNIITISNHGFLIDQPVRYSSGGGDPINPLQNGSTYYIKEIVDENRFTLSQSLQGPTLSLVSAGTGSNHSFILNIVNLEEDSIYIPSHGYVSGQTVRYQKSRDLTISSVSSSGTSRFITTTEPHNLQNGSRVTFDNFNIPSISTPEILITQIGSSGQTRTLTLASSHNLIVGNYVVVVGLTGTNNSRFNGIYIVSGVPSSNQINYIAEESFTLTLGQNPDVEAFIKHRTDLDYQAHLFISDIRSISSSGTTRTIDTKERHYLPNGFPVVIEGISGNIPGIQGDIGEYFNGTYFINSVPTTNRFTYIANQDYRVGSSNGTRNLDPSISFGTTNVGSDGLNNSGTAYRDVIVDTISSSTVFRYQMPNSSFTQAGTVATGKTSKIGVRINNRNLSNRTVGRLTFDVNHDLENGDRFVVTGLTGSNQDVFNGEYRVSNVVNTTNIDFISPEIKTKIESRRLFSNTNLVINTENPNNLVTNNFVYFENNSGNDGNFWDYKVNIISRQSEGTTRTISTDSPHYFATNDRVRIVSIDGEGASNFIGDFIVNGVPSATQFTYIGNTSITIASAPANGITKRAVPITAPAFTITARSRSANVADITVNTTHGFEVGEKIRINNIGGPNPEVFNGEWTIASVPATNRVTFITPTSGAIANATVGGTMAGVYQLRYGIPTYQRFLSSRELISNTVALFTTSFDHHFEVGTTVTVSGISGNNPNIFNGTFVINNVPSAKVFTVTRPQAANVTTFTVTSRLRTVNVADVTLNTTHNLQVGNTITISNMSGADANIFNGTHVITAIPATNRVQFFTETSGTITSAAVSGNVTVDQVQSANVTGTITLNTIPKQTVTSGETLLREVAGLGVVGELNTNTEIFGLKNQKIYFVQRIDANTLRLHNNRTLTNTETIDGVGIGSHSIITFSVDFAANTITIPNHGFSLGELVEYDTLGETEINGLTSGTPYYIIPIDGNTIKLATSNINAENGVAIDLIEAPAPTGRHQLKSLIRTPDGTYTISRVTSATDFEVTANGSVPEIVKTFSPRFSLDITQNFIKIPSHGFLTGTKVTYSDGGETPIGGLTDGQDYFVISVSKDWLRLASTVDNAQSGVPLQLTSFGAGLSHTLTSFQINGNITGTGTISTTEGSVLVEGSGTNFSKILKVGDNLRIFPPDTEQPAFFASTDVNTSTEEITLAAHQFSTGNSVVFSPGSGGPRREIFQITASTTSRTIRTREAHGFTTGNIVTISGLSSTSASEFEGTYSITGTPDVYQFTYTGPSSLTTAITNEVQTTGIAQTSGVAGVAPSPLIDGYYYFIRSIPNESTFSINNRNRTNNILDFTTTVNHNLRAGNQFTISNITGVNPEVFNGTFTVVHVPATNRVQALATIEGVNIGAVGVTGTLTPLSSNTVKIYNTSADAIADTNSVDIASGGSGFALKLAKIIPSTPIIRKISAIGGDNQITVNRPYSTSYDSISYSYPTFVYVRPQGYSLHRPFDGGVEMSTGFGTWFGSIIRQTRKYFRYQSGKGLQTSAGINFKPSIDIEDMRQIGTSQVISVRTRRPHGLVNGLFVRLDDAQDSQGVTSQIYNGTVQVTVLDSFNFTYISNANITENRSYGYPRMHVTEWSNGALRSGMFDDQNGMFFEFDGQKLYAVRRSSTQQISGTVAALQGSEFIFGTNTTFQGQLVVGDYIVLRGQSYKVSSVLSDTRISIKPEYKGSSGEEKEFDPSSSINTSDSSITILGHGYTQDIPVVYNSIDGSPAGGLINGNTYYVSVVDNNRFKLKASPDATQTVTLSTTGSGEPHSFTAAKTGIIATLTEDTRVPQEEWSIDPCDGTGITGYNLDLSKIQMIYMDYSWYGAGKIRFGFKTTDGQVKYVHEFVHNNQKFESYFRSGNLPGRYEVVTFENPTYIPYLFHWGTSVMMDGRFDDDRAYLFSKSSPSLNIGGTTAKTFGSNAISPQTEIINIPNHGFATGDALQFKGIGSTGTLQANSQNPGIEVISGINSFSNLQNEETYFSRTINPNNIILYYREQDVNAPTFTVASRSKSGFVVDITTNAAHGYVAGNSVFVNMSTDTFAASFNGCYRIESTPTATRFTYRAFIGNRDVGAATPPPGTLVSRNVINFTNSGNSQATYSLSPAGTLDNTSGANYQPLISLRLSPSVSEGLTGGLGDRDVINRMQLRLQEVGIQTNELVDVKILLNGRLNNLNFLGVDSPSLVQVIEHTSNDTISGGVQVYNFRASGQAGQEQTTSVNVDELFELSNSILGGNSVFPDGPDVLTVAVARLTGTETLTSAKLSWAEAQA